MRNALRILSLAPLLVAACNSDGLSPAAPDGGSRRAPDLARACSSAGSEADCDTIDGCLAVTCPACGGGDTFMECVQKGQPYGVLCSSPCAEPACADVTDSADCDARTDCYSLYSGDLPCNSSGCSNHFERCLDGASAPCTPPAGGGGDSCTQLTPKCASGDSTDYLANGCPGGCVHESRCAP